VGMIGSRSKVPSEDISALGAERGSRGRNQLSSDRQVAYVSY
jgi:hypothetical protein